jgi:hypothetical protein
MMYSSAHCIGLLLALLAPGGRSTAPQPTKPKPKPKPDIITTMAKGEDQSTLSEQYYVRAVEHAGKQQYHDAAKYIVKAYAALSNDVRFHDSGLNLLIEATDYHVKAYHESGDDDLLAEIQPLLEQFVAQYAGLNANASELRRNLESIRELRLSASSRHFDEKKYAKAAIEAHDCYRVLQDADKGKAFGEKAALAASRAYRQAWYVDGDARHIEAAVEVIGDHLAKVGAQASLTAKREQRQLEGDLRRAKAGPKREDESQGSRRSPRDRSFLIASSAGIAGGIALSGGAAFVGVRSFDFEFLLGGAAGPIRARPEQVVTAIPLGLVGGVITGLAVHSMADAGFIPSRTRKILAASTITLGLLGVAAGSSLMAIGSAREPELTTGKAKALQNAGFSVLVGMGAPLGAGIAALVSRWTRR